MNLINTHKNYKCALFLFYLCLTLGNNFISFLTLLFAMETNILNNVLLKIIFVMNMREATTCCSGCFLLKKNV